MRSDVCILLYLKVHSVDLQLGPIVVAAVAATRGRVLPRGLPRRGLAAIAAPAAAAPLPLLPAAREVREEGGRRPVVDLVSRVLPALGVGGGGVCGRGGRGPPAGVGGVELVLPEVVGGAGGPQQVALVAVAVLFLAGVGGAGLDGGNDACSVVRGDFAWLDFF